MKDFDREVCGYYSRIKGFAFRFVKNEADAEDIAQETLLSAITQRNFKGESSLGTWLLSIARFKALSLFRKKKTWKEEGGEAYDNALEKLYVNPNQHDALELAEILDKIQALPEIQREAIIQTRILGREGADVASSVGSLNGTIKTRVFYGVKKLGENYVKARQRRHALGASSRKRLTETPIALAPAYPARHLGPESQVWKETQERLGPGIATPLLMPGQLQAFGMVFALHKVIMLPDGQEQRIYRAA